MAEEAAAAAAVGIFMPLPDKSWPLAMVRPASEIIDRLRRLLLFRLKLMCGIRAAARATGTLEGRPRKDVIENVAEM